MTVALGPVDIDGMAGDILQRIGRQILVELHTARPASWHPGHTVTVNGRHPGTVDRYAVGTRHYRSGHHTTARAFITLHDPDTAT